MTELQARIALRMLVFTMIVSSMLAAACSVLPAPSQAPASISLNVSNGTSLDVAIAVNGQMVAVIRANGAVEPTIPASHLPPLPWAVEARSSSGRVLMTMQVSREDATQTDPNIHVIPMGRVDLSCGRLTLWAGDVPPSGPAPPSPAGSPGDCEP